MELLPEFGLSWLGGWLPLALLVLTEGILFLSFPKPVVANLFDRSGWTRRQAVRTVLGKLLALVGVAMIMATPLKAGSPALVVGAALIALGLAGFVKALLDYRNAPIGQPATRGLYGFTRHPQILAAWCVLLGSAIGIGSWLALALLVVARIPAHASLVAEEEACLRAYGQSYRDYMDRVPRYPLRF